MNTALVFINENSRRIGETHPRARLTDEEVDLIKSAIEEGGLTHRELAEKFEVSESTVKSISCGRRRSQTPAGQSGSTPAQSRYCWTGGLLKSGGATSMLNANAMHAKRTALDAS